MKTLKPEATRTLIAGVIAATLMAAAACGDDSNPNSPTPRGEYSQTDVRVGTGTEATNGKRLSVNYTGWLYNPSGQDGKGQQFDTSTGRGAYAFTLGAGQVISGWDRGVAGMKVGGVRRLVLPPELAYGSSGNGPIPGNATLVFDIELLEVQ
jgi:FKBP-type peptidyl-prolyl cis-trans isomerase FkpA